MAQVCSHTALPPRPAALPDARHHDAQPAQPGGGAAGVQKRALAGRGECPAGWGQQCRPALLLMGPGDGAGLKSRVAGGNSRVRWDAARRRRRLARCRFLGAGAQPGQSGASPCLWITCTVTFRPIAAPPAQCSAWLWQQQQPGACPCYRRRSHSRRRPSALQDAPHNVPVPSSCTPACWRLQTAASRRRRSPSRPSCPAKRCVATS